MLDRQIQVNDPWRRQVAQRIRAIDKDSLSGTIAELHSIAKQLDEQGNTAPSPERLSSLSQKSARLAAGLLAGIFDCVPSWQTVLPLLLRWQYADVSILDEPASMVVMIGENPVTLPSGQVTYLSQYPKRVFENEMQRGWLDRHYVDQAERWARLIRNAALMIEADAHCNLPSGKKLVCLRLNELREAGASWPKALEIVNKEFADVIKKYCTRAGKLTEGTAYRWHKQTGVTMFEGTRGRKKKSPQQ